MERYYKILNFNCTLALTLLSLFLFGDISSQVEVGSVESNWISYSQIQLETKRILDSDRFQGDLYLEDNWKHAVFALSSKDSVVIDSVKLNLLRGRVEIFIDGQHLEIDNQHYESFMFLDNTDATFRYRHYYYYDGNRLPGIIKVLDAGEYNVIVSYDPELRQISKENPFMLGEMKKDRVRITKLRFIERDGELSRIKSKKDFEKYFGMKSIKKYISKNKLSHKDENDIAAVLKHFQTIQ